MSLLFQLYIEVIQLSFDFEIVVYPAGRQGEICVVAGGISPGISCEGDIQDDAIGAGLEN